MSRPRTRRALYLLRSFVTFFLLMSFIITCCMLLFLTELTAAMEITLTESVLQKAAKLTFANIIFLSLVCSVIDFIRKKITVDRPVKQILRQAERIISGDFSARIQPFSGLHAAYGFDVIADCFNRMASELSGTETLRNDFIANVSHELKTPLAIIQNYAAMLSTPGLPEQKRREYSCAIADTSRRLADLITNILKLNKLENQQIFPAKQRYNLSEQLCECLLSFENEWEKKSLEIETDIAENVFIEADSELMSIVWNNLFSNAIKFTTDGGKISLTLKSDGEYVAVTVSDTGCGISNETGKHIFEKFYQGDRSHATNGNGLGLALVKRIMDITGGEISVQSEVGKGSVFTVRLWANGEKEV